MDISIKMLDIARQANLPNVDYRSVDGFALPEVPDRSADLALGYCVFQHLPSDAALKSYLHEMHRVTKPGGLIAFTLVPRNWTVWIMPVLRARAYLRERTSTSMNRGPKGIYQREWAGIRPSAATVAALSPVLLERRFLEVERVLYFGRRVN
jgi:ubiquinone/menaquinone biosynthesis C-methylase UbiE